MSNTELTIAPLFRVIWELDRQIELCEKGKANMQSLIDYLKAQKDTAEERLEVEISLITDAE